MCVYDMHCEWYGNRWQIVCVCCYRFAERGQNVFDVYSKSQGTGLDGSSYVER